MRKRGALVLGVLVLCAAGLAGLAFGDRALKTSVSRRTALRAYNGATVQQYDTLAVNEDERVELVTFQVYADDSAQTPTLTCWFVSSNNKTVYLKLSDSYTANQIKTTVWDADYVFPKDSTILVYYNITGATPGTLDSVIVNATYRLQRMQ